MEVADLGDDDLISIIDWNDGFADEIAAALEEIDDSSPPAPVTCSFDEIEKELMRDEEEVEDDDGEKNKVAKEFCDGFLADILIDDELYKSASGSPVNSSPSPVANASPADSSSSPAVNDSPADSSSSPVCDVDGDEQEEGEDDDNKARKRRRERQSRNRDAAVRSRERKKEYVKELEMKSKYLEAECRRLGNLLQWCCAENHWLRVANATKQESAVLLMESLLLGSLLWWLTMIPVTVTTTTMSLFLRLKPEKRDPAGVETPPAVVVRSLVEKRRTCRASFPKIKHPLLVSF